MPESDLVYSGGFIGSDVLHHASDALYLRVICKGYGEMLRVPYTAGAKAALVSLFRGNAGGRSDHGPIPAGSYLRPRFMDFTW